MSTFDEAVKTSVQKQTTYDPIIGFSKGETDIPGYDIWPENGRLRNSDLKIMITGGSTSTWPIGEWSKLLGELITDAGRRPFIFNGGVEGYSTSQELLKIIRDVPALKPDMIISLSGINDMAWLHNHRDHSLVHKYQFDLSNYLEKSLDAFSNTNFGVSCREEPDVTWLRNVSLMQAVARTMSTKILCCVQPIIVYGDYCPNSHELEFMNPVAYRDVSCRELNYEGEAIDFYDKILHGVESQPMLYEHVLDISKSFAGKSGLFRDYRHQNSLGDIIIAEKIFMELQKRKWL